MLSLKHLESRLLMTGKTAEAICSNSSPGQVSSRSISAGGRNGLACAPDLEALAVEMQALPRVNLPVFPFLLRPVKESFSLLLSDQRGKTNTFMLR